MNDKETVLAKYPDAHAKQYTEWDWVIYPFKHYQLASELGEASTESEAWTKAACKVSNVEITSRRDELR